MGNTVRASDYLKAPAKYPPAAVCAVFGDEEFLKRQTLRQLRREVLGEGDADFSLTTLDGEEAQWPDLNDELSTLSMFGGKRLVIVESADAFVSKNRPQLENYVGKPRAGSVLVLEVGTWQANTRLYKAVDAAGLQVNCKALEAKDATPWLVNWAKQAHSLRLPRDAAEMLVQMLGLELGLLDQELAKLAVSAGPDGAIDVQMVRQLAAWRASTAWDMLDAALEGNAAEALAQLDRLVMAGENAIAIVAMLFSSLRRLASATRTILQTEAAGQRATPRQALQQAGVNPYYLEKTEKQLRRLGRQRGRQLYNWMLQADLDLKGASKLPPRTVLERLIARIAAP